MAESFIPTAGLHRWVDELWRAAGSNEQEALLTADHLVGANLAGHDSHGVGMIPRYVKSLLAGELQLNQAVTTVVDAGTLVALDGHHGMGQSIAFQAMEIAIERTRRHGVCAMGLRNAHHIGRVGHWAEQAIAAGFASIHFTNAVSPQAMVAPYGGAQPRFLTNPFTVGIPRSGAEPILLDFATSAIAYGKVRVAYNRRSSVPAGCLIDAQGRPTENPAVMFEAPLGALVPFGAHKGYALAMVCELLGGALAGGPTMRPDAMNDKYAIWNGMFALVFDPQRMGSGSTFEDEARRFTAWVQSENDSILMPGDPERRSRKQRAEAVPIDGETLAELNAAAADVARASGKAVRPLSALAR